MEFEFWIKPGIGEVRCENIGTKLPAGNEKITEDSDNKELKGLIYKAKNVPVGHVTLLKVTLTSRH
jgi:hypothetical protein